MDYFNKVMIEANATLVKGNPVQNVEINPEKNFAFLEFRTPEEATACMNFDGYTFQGQTLRIKRPKDYAEGFAAGPLTPGSVPGAGGIIGVPGVPPGVGLSAAAVAAVGARLLPQIPESPNKVFVGGIPSYFNEEQVRELLSTVGTLKHLTLVRDQITGLSKGFAFCEWIDDDTTDKACAALDGIQLGEKTLTVHRNTKLTTPTTPSVHPLLAGGLAGGLTAASVASIIGGVQSAAGVAASTPGIGGGTYPSILPAHPLNVAHQLARLSSQMPANTNILPPAILNKLPQTNINIVGAPSSNQGAISNTSVVPTRVLLLLNMVTEEDLYDNEEYEDIVADIEEECNKFGPVKGVLVPRPPARGVGCAFVEFEDVGSCLDAQASLEGRKFAARIVKASFFSEDAYRNRQF
eukprot:c20136_g1_i4.p1 GENE.c20136_g1_i4~~c20136_g1_i4.p1  ORF type:complete len:408 (+),score=223.76 c20136_g1_i4:72-1295(+)